ncbi:MAG: hypothetical protein JSR33_08490 [Proteobacteria bacterium]|nr:hypothetical protein [Pseudomonadota bacterium]
MLKEDKQRLINFGELATRLHEKAKVLRIVVKQILLESKQSEFLWSFLHGNTTEQLGVLLEKANKNAIMIINNYIQAFFYHNYHLMLIDPVDYQQIFNSEIKKELENKAEILVSAVKQDFNTLPVSDINPIHRELLFLFAEVIFHIISSYNFLTYQFELTSEWCSIQKIKKDYGERFKKKLKSYQSSVLIALDEKCDQSEMEFYNKKLHALQIYEIDLGHKVGAFRKLLEQKKDLKDVQSRWQEYISTARPKASDSPLTKIEQAISSEYQSSEAERQKMACAFDEIEKATVRKVECKEDGNPDEFTKGQHDISFLSQSRMSFEALKIKDNTKAEIIHSLSLIEAKLPKSGRLIKSVQKDWRNFYDNFASIVTTLVDNYEFHRNVEYLHLCPAEFNSNSLPALRVKIYQEDYKALHGEFKTYLGNLQTELQQVQDIKQNPSLKGVSELVTKALQKVSAIEQSFSQELGLGNLEASTKASASSSFLFGMTNGTASSINDQTSSSSASTPVTDAPSAAPPIGPAPKPKESASNCWARVFYCCYSNPEETAPLLNSDTLNPDNPSINKYNK